MKLINKVKKLREALLGAEMEIEILEADIYELTIDLNQLYGIESNLVYNINFLKKEGIVAVASEYRKSRDQLEKIQQRIKKYCSVKNKSLEEAKRKIDNRDNIEVKFKKYYKQLEDDQVILIFKLNKEKL